MQNSIIEVEQRPRAQHEEDGDTPSYESSSSSSSPAQYVYDPLGDARVRRLRLARQWKETGATYEAIWAYTDMLFHYAGMNAAAAAAEELLEMVPAIEAEGRFYAALDIFRKIEHAG